MRNAAVILIASTLALGYLASRWGSESSMPAEVAQELARLRFANSVLQSKLDGHEAQSEQLKRRLANAKAKLAKTRDQACSSSNGAAEVDANPPPPPEAASSAPLTGAKGNMTDVLLYAHSRWDWRAIVTEMLQPWPRIEGGQLETAVAACNDNGTMYCQRFQIIDGTLYVTDYRAIFFDRHYAPARVMPILETLRRHPSLPNMDLVVAGNDEPRVPSSPGDRYSWSKTCRRWPGSNAINGGVSNRMPPAIFASTGNRAAFDLPWLDFAWFFPRRPHKLRTPPWSVLQPQLVKAGGSVKWETKIELAMHTGNVGSPWRKVLAQEATKHPNEILVNELFIGDHGKIRSTCKELGLDRKGGFQQHKCFMKFEDQCGYKYLLNSASIGYANKFKYLLLCGSVVIYVNDGMSHKEYALHCTALRCRERLSSNSLSPGFALLQLSPGFACFFCCGLLRL